MKDDPGQGLLMAPVEGVAPRIARRAGRLNMIEAK